jgi:hypoxanthine-DNA glycosylase
VSGAPHPARLQGLAPVLDASTRLLVLGSFPGAASLAAGQYYGHPHNAFWKIVAATWLGDPQALRLQPYAVRLDCLRAHGLGLWDVFASCQRQGSLDAAIRAPERNDLPALLGQCPHLQAIAHNGAASYRQARHCAELGLPVHQLPSTSPAHASWSFARKLEAWQAVFARYGLC